MNTDSIPAEVCEDCGYAECEKKRFLDTKPQWVGDDGEYYRNCEPTCNYAAKTLGARYAELWKLARAVCRAEEYCFNEAGNVMVLYDFMKSNTRQP